MGAVHRIPDLPPDQMEALLTKRIIRLSRTGVPAADVALLYCVTPAKVERLVKAHAASQAVYQHRIDLKLKRAAYAAKRAARAADKSTT